MRYGFEHILALNTGTPTEPVWAAINVAGDSSIDDDSDEVDASRRSDRGRKVTSRSLLSRGLTFAIDAAASSVGDSIGARLLRASRTRDGVVDVCAFDDAVVDWETGLVTAGLGTRFAALVKLTDQQPMGDRRLNEYELKPGRLPVSWAAAGIPAIDPSYSTDGILTEDGELLLTEDDELLLLEV